MPNVEMRPKLQLGPTRGAVSTTTAQEKGRPASAAARRLASKGIPAPITCAPFLPGTKTFSNRHRKQGLGGCAATQLLLYSARGSTTSLPIKEVAVFPGPLSVKVEPGRSFKLLSVKHTCNFHRVPHEARLRIKLSHRRRVKAWPDGPSLPQQDASATTRPQNERLSSAPRLRL